MLEEVVCSVANFYAIDELVSFAPGEPDHYEFIFGAFEVVENC